MGTVEKQTAFFHHSTALGKLDPRTVEFSTVPTAATTGNQYEAETQKRKLMVLGHSQHVALPN
jgi:hypothetical protein